MPRLLAPRLALLIVDALAACGDDDGTAAPDDAPATSTTAASKGADPAGPGDGDAGAYPVTVDTRLGPVTIDERPERIVALGRGDAEPALAPGAQPVGAADRLELSAAYPLGTTRATRHATDELVPRIAEALGS